VSQERLSQVKDLFLAEVQLYRFALALTDVASDINDHGPVRLGAAHRYGRARIKFALRRSAAFRCVGARPADPP
jgi:hypothetical protein